MNPLLFSIVLLSGTATGNAMESVAPPSAIESDAVLETERTAADGDSASKPAYRQVTMYKGKFRISVPAHFTVMSPEMVQIKYPNAKQQPDVVYSDESGSINIVLSKKDLPTEAGDLPDVMKVFEQQLKAAKPEDLKSSIRKINGHDYVILEFISQAADARIHNLMFLTNLGGQLLVGSINCTAQRFANWQPKGLAVLASARK